MLTGKSALAIKSNFTRDDLRRISEDGGGWRLSLYMPLHRTGREVRQAPILLKDLRARAAEELQARGCDPVTTSDLLAPVQQVLEDADFALLQGEGLAVLSARGFNASFLMPIAPPALSVVGKRFQLDPLLPLLYEDGRFHLLALSLNSARLWEFDHRRAREIALDGVATNLRAALRFEEGDSALSARTGGSMGAGAYHGHGWGRTDIKDRKRDILEFFRQIDKGLRKLAGQDAPLMLAGVEHLLPLYREASAHPRLMEWSVLGNPDVTSEHEALHAKARRLHADAQALDRKQALRLYGERLATPQAAAGIRNVLAAAAGGRVSRLFLRKGFRQWGTFDADAQRVAFADGPGPEAEDLANLACIHTLLGAGKVHVVEEGEIPERAEIAALCRY